MQAVLNELSEFIGAEQEAGASQLLKIWQTPLDEKLASGKTQPFIKLAEGPTQNTIWAYLDTECESRFREGDLICLHDGNALEGHFLKRLTLEEEQTERWLLTGFNISRTIWEEYSRNPCYGDPDALDLSGLYEKALDDIASSYHGREVILPLLSGSLPTDNLNTADYDYAADAAEEEGLNEDQVDAVGWALGADSLACIQGPPGTGKTRVLAFIAKLLVERGERVLVSSHTHMAINNALNKIHQYAVPVAKVGRYTSTRGLDSGILSFGHCSEWKERPSTSGYVIGATPFATCTPRLEEYEFDTLIFDEASQVTPALAVMAMRKAKRFIFIGDHKQLPPVVLSHSVLDQTGASVFSRLLNLSEKNVITLNTTYRMNRTLTRWPSDTYYQGQLHAEGSNAQRLFKLPSDSGVLAEVLGNDSLIFIESLQAGSRSSNHRDAIAVARICQTAIAGGIMASEIGVVTPFRNQGRQIKSQLTKVLGDFVARKINADTVERMQGQERELVILSLATTDPDFLELLADFIFQPQRLNVSITRSKAKLIILGPSPHRIPNHLPEPVSSWVKDYCSLISICKKEQWQEV